MNNETPLQGTVAAAPTKQDKQKMYDYILVGAGPSAMGLLHGFLSRKMKSSSNTSNGTCSILVIEAGNNSSSHTDTDKLNSWYRAAHSQVRSRDNATNKVGTTLLSSAPQSGLNDRIIDIPCGSGLGGGSNINAGLLVRPDFNRDFQSWPGRWKNGRVMKDACDVVEDVMWRNGAVEEWSYCDSFMNLIGRKQKQVSAASVDGIGYDKVRTQFHSNVCFAASNGYRVNYYESLVQPLLRLDRKAEHCITFMTDTRVNRVLWSREEEENEGNEFRQIKRRANGVSCSDADGVTFAVQARKEVILCAGAIHTPVLLMQSGIGDLDELPKSVMEACGNYVHKLPAVGKNLRDHLIIPRIFLTSPQFRVRQSRNAIQAWYTTRQTNSDGAAVVSKANNVPVSQMIISDGAIMAHVGPSCIAAPFRLVSLYFEVLFFCIYHLMRMLLDFSPLHYLATKMTAVLLVCLMNPASTGSIRLREGKRMVKDNNGLTVVIDPGYLAEKADVELIEEIWQQSDDIANRHYSSCVEVLPGPFYRLVSRSYVAIFARHFAQPYFHWMGTCAIGCNDQDGCVVDENLQVSGVQCLRICDASVFAGPISSPTALACAALGYAASAFLFNDGNEMSHNSKLVS
uniref:Glucose-methanol-choline oxidoreductase N-terminal domain-containing protein n=2 Tax=Leptocylindrus danicus TaxID=163516 RepID=A0A7S2PAW9_9STRA|mmetsp:Transcript_28038/g.41298  ORF Transcript_28038/g.41298 Transcript_28038/m.41298 type:complete len:627 (+) Transcript_28038:432-2312(+)